MKRTLVGAVAGLALMVAGCSASGDAPTGPVEPTKNADRDVVAVTQAAAVIDPCALLDPGVVQSMGFTEVTQNNIGTCTARTADTGGPSITVDVASNFSSVFRVPAARTSLNGAVAYHSYNSSLSRDQGCSIDLPISFELSVNFSYSGQITDHSKCEPAERYASSVAATLIDNPSAFRRADLSTAIPAPCDIYRQALSDSVDVMNSSPSSPINDLRICILQNPTNPMDHSVSLTIDSPEYAEKSLVQGSNDVKATIGGHTVHFEKGDDPNECSATWVAAREIAPIDSVLIVELNLTDCAPSPERDKLILQFVTAAEAPATPPEPGTPFLYSEQDPDTEITGPCQQTDAPSLYDCAPAVTVEVPAEPAARLDQENRANRADILCAAAGPAVREVFGKALQAVTARLGICTFVEPTRQMYVTIGASPSNLEESENEYISLDTKRQATIAGHPAVIQSDEITRRARISLTSPDKGPTLVVTVGIDGINMAMGLPPLNRAPFDNFEASVTPIAKAIVGE